MVRSVASRSVAVLWAAVLCGCSQDTAAPEAAQSPAVVSSQPATTPAVTPSSAPPAPAADAAPDVAALLAAARQAVQLGDGPQALQHINAAIAAAPTAPEPLLLRAELMTAAELPTQAIADLTRALELDPQNARTLNTRGYLRMSQGDLDSAMADFTTAVGIDLEYPQPYNNRGLVRISQGQPQTALHDFDAALRIDPNYIDAHNNRGYTLMLLKRHAEAVAALTQAIEIDRQYVNAWNNRGLAHKDWGLQIRSAAESDPAGGAAAEADWKTKLEAACADFAQAISLQPSHSKYYLHRSETLAALGREAEAKADVEHVVWLERLSLVNRRVASAPQEAGVWLERAEHMRVGRRFDAAVADIQRAIQLIGAGRPETGDAYVLQARILLEQGQVEQAIEAANIALRGGFHEQAYSVRGDAYYQLQNYEAAVDDYRQARRLDPLVRQAYELRAQQLESSGQVEQAGYFREQASELAPERLTRPGAESSANAPPFPLDPPPPAAAAPSPGAVQ